MMSIFFFYTMILTREKIVCSVFLVISWSLYFRFKEHCPPEFIQDPDNQIEIPTGWDLPLTTGEIIEGQRFVQISPQKVRLKLRPNRTSKFTFGVIQAKQYPVDLYYLMDLSNSMVHQSFTSLETNFHILTSSRYLNGIFIWRNCFC